MEAAAPVRINGLCVAIKPNHSRCYARLLIGEGDCCARHRPVELAPVVRVVPPLIAPVVRNDGELARIARDSQNVHTHAVNRQMNAGLEQLTKLIVPPTQKTMPEVMSAMLTGLLIKNVDMMLELFRDINRWYNTVTCVTPNDKLYKRALDGLWSKIRSTEDDTIRKSLVYRLYQETYEARDLCCDGHLSRLCNVMVGFDENFLPPVSLGELLQNAMAAIANKSISTEEKIVEANAVFYELSVPLEDRSAWLDAF